MYCTGVNCKFTALGTIVLRKFGRFLVNQKVKSKHQLLFVSLKKNNNILTPTQVRKFTYTALDFYTNLKRASDISFVSLYRAKPSVKSVLIQTYKISFKNFGKLLALRLDL